MLNIKRSTIKRKILVPLIEREKLFFMASDMQTIIFKAERILMSSMRMNNYNSFVARMNLCT